MKFVILLTVFGAALCAPAGTYVYESFPFTTTTQAPFPALQPAVQYVPQTYTNTYSAPALPTVRYFSVHPTPVVTGNLYNFVDTYGQYKFGYSQSDGQSKTETKQTDGGVAGQFSYVDPEGKRVELSYMADKDGFRAVGDHLPIAPEVPEMPADLAQAYNEAHQRLRVAYEEARLRPPVTAYDDGSYKPEAVPMDRNRWCHIRPFSCGVLIRQLSTGPQSPAPTPAPVKSGYIGNSF